MQTNPEYFLIYDLVHSMQESSKKFSKNTKIVNGKNLNQYFLENGVFSELINNQYIRQLHYSGKIIDCFDDYYHDAVNTYNGISHVLHTLKKTIPIILIKPYKLYHQNKCDIYTDVISSILDNTQYPVQIDATFQKLFDLPCIITKNDINIYDNTCNSYLNLFNMQSNIMFCNIKNNIDLIFSHYDKYLFRSTETLFLNNVPPLMSVYSYTTPITNYRDQEDLRIYNVFNLNIWFFYFFKYLDTFNESEFAQFMTQYLTNTGIIFLKKMTTLLKINIEYYMHEFSYILNDLYSKSPSADENDTFKNYVPVSKSPVLENIGIKTDLVAITLIFHRNHIPTITEMFQFIFNFIDSISPNDIEVAIDFKLGLMDTTDVTCAKTFLKLFYQNIFSYFMHTYDSFEFEEPANYIPQILVSDEIDSVIKNYSVQFLNSISSTISQMEFYFVAEMIYTRQIQKFYYNMLSNQNLITEHGGTLAADITSLLDNILSRHGFGKVDLSAIDQPYGNINLENPDNKNILETYLNYTFQENRLYYTTSNFSRFNGKSYIDTPYVHRNGHLVEAPLEKPIPIPPSNIYGIDSEFYNHGQTNSTISEIPVYWVKTNNYGGLDDDIDNRDCHKSFQLYKIDYFRIKHNIFLDHIVCSSRSNTVSDIELEHAKIMHYLEKLKTNIRVYDNVLLVRLYDSVTNYMMLNKDSRIYLLEFQNILFNSLEIEDYLFNNQTIEYIIHHHSLQKIPNKYTYIDLLQHNEYVETQIFKNKNNCLNIIDVVEALRDNFISQYYYYTAIKEKINILQNTKTNSYENMTYLLHSMIHQIKDKDENMSQLKSLSIFGTYSGVGRLQSDLSYNSPIFKKGSFSAYVYSFFMTRKNLYCSAKDVIDNINVIFISIVQIYDYLKNNELCPEFLDIINSMHSMTRIKNKINTDIWKIMTDLISSKKLLSTIDIDHILDAVGMYNIDHLQVKNYLTTIFNQHSMKQ